MYGLLEYAVYDSFSGVVYPVAVSVKSQSGGNNFAAYGEVSGIKYVERAILQACPSGVNSFLSACCAALAQTTLVLLPGKSHGQRSLAGCGPRGRRVGHH